MNYKSNIIIALLLTVFVIQLKAQDMVDTDQDTVGIKLNIFQQEPGDKIEFPINFSISDFGLVAFELTIYYDPSVLKPVSVDEASSWDVFINPVEPGKILAGAYWANSAFQPGGQTTDFTPVSIGFEVIGLPGQVSLVNIVEVGLYDNNENALEYELTNGQVAINCNDDIHIGDAEVHKKLEQGVFRANNNLTSHSLVEAVSDSVLFKAGQSIFLQPNFEVTKGSTFSTTISNCSELEISNKTIDDSCDLND